jgi:hypothetical protein
MQRNKTGGLTIGRDSYRNVTRREAKKFPDFHALDVDPVPISPAFGLRIRSGRRRLSPQELGDEQSRSYSDK